jgi:hypothetical protein
MAAINPGFVPAAADGAEHEEFQDAYQADQDGEPDMQAGQQDAPPPNFDPLQPINFAQAAQLYATIAKGSEERILAAFRGSLPPPSAPFANAKRKADDISNEGIKKQYILLEETKLRLQSMKTKLQGVAEGQEGAIGPEEAAQLQKTLDEGLDLVDKRIFHLEIAQTEGWTVARQMEKNYLMMELPEDLQKRA